MKLAGNIREGFLGERTFGRGVEDTLEFAGHYSQRKQSDQRVAGGEEDSQAWGVVVSI